MLVYFYLLPPDDELDEDLDEDDELDEEEPDEKLPPDLELEDPLLNDPDDRLEPEDIELLEELLRDGTEYVLLVLLLTVLLCPSDTDELLLVVFLFVPEYEDTGLSVLTLLLL